MNAVKTRQLKTNVFKKDWEKGHNPSQPIIEVEEKDGTITRKKPTGRVYNVCDMKDEELGDFLGEDERRALEIGRKQRAESTGRDLCKEFHDKKGAEETEKQKRVEVLEQREKVWVEYSRQQEEEMRKMKKDMEKMAGLLSQLISKA